MKPADGSKKRTPPTFWHLPVNRAKKLKQSWVDAQKIKSQWKAQKRKEGIVAKGSQIEELVEGEHDNAAPSGSTETEEKMSRQNRSRSTSEDVDEFSEENGSDGSGVDETKHASRKPRSSQSARQRQMRPTITADSFSLRDLQRQAHSKTPIHMSGHRGSDAKCGSRSTTPGRDQGRGCGMNVSQRGRGQPRSRGQPDMRVRMNAMLERIKRDFP